MTITRGRGRSILLFSTLVLAASIAVYAILGQTLWLLAVAASLSCASALVLSRAWRVHLAGALLLCLGATTTTASAAALWATLQCPAQRALSPAEWDAVWNDVAPLDVLEVDPRADGIIEALHQVQEEAKRSRHSDDPASHQRGRADAELDLERGVLRLKGYGMPVWWIEEYDRILLEEYNVEREWVAGCVVTTELVEHANGYNDVMEAAIMSKFGDDFFDRVTKRAREAHDAASGD
jgi:hypothetical protein